MSVLKLTLITCDGCGETYASGDSKGDTAEQQRAEYKVDGWSYARGGLDFCSECKGQ